MDTREVPPHGSPTSFTAGRAWPGALPRRPSAWLLLLAIPFWFTVWCLNLPTRTCHRPDPGRELSVARTMSHPSLSPSLGRYRLGDYPRHRCSRLVLTLPSQDEPSITDY
jgi:hypothetical protein